MAKIDSHSKIGRKTKILRKLLITNMFVMALLKTKYN